ncbi:hypothetical protein ACIP2X_37335 [Streptomyces sp. NPDC089424]|uniref:hypothetical protein n=1 Tax=Streptomyces sp. NPDC089424 TaxID=3365917 RepID=UPI003807809E
MTKKTPSPRAAQVAPCAETPARWRRRGRRGVVITIIVIELLRIAYGQVTWDNPLEGALIAAIGLLTLDTLAGAARAVGRVLRRMVPERMVLERRNGRRRLAFGW